MIKKLISSILSVTILASCITFSNSEATVKADSTTTNSSNMQILFNGKLNEVEKDNVTTLKTISGTDVENEFEITLEVTTAEDLKNIAIEPDAATVLVLDRSGSMDEKDGDSTSRFKEMQDAANAFLEQYANVEKGIKRLVSIVSFADDAKNETYSNGANTWINVTEELSNARSKITNLTKPNGGTNIEGALILANNIVANGKSTKALDGIGNINIILLTDGCPTFHASNSNSTSIKSINGSKGGGNVAYTTDWKPVGGTVNNISANTTNISKNIKDAGINLYTIAFSTTEVSFYTTDPTDGWWGDDGTSVKLNPSTWMSGFATRNFSANNADELAKQFEKINKLIALSAQAWKVTDPMGDNIIFKNVIDANSDNVSTFNTETNTLMWDLKNSSPVESTTEQGNKKYTYTLKYKVVLDTTNSKASYDDVSTNGTTILDYYLFSKQGDDQTVELKHASFNVPRVQGLFGNLNFTKVNEDEQPMKGVTFTLTGTSTGSNKEVTISATSDDNGHVSFSNIPAGVYKLTETTPNGYIAAGPWDVVVSYGNTTKDVTLGDTIINYPQTRDISVEKKWAGLPEGSSDYPESVTVKLLANGIDTGKTLILNSSNSWSGTFEKVPYVNNEGMIVYTLEEINIPGYQVGIIGENSGENFTITNTYSPETMDISGVKSWVDEDGESSITGSVPDITITLQRTLADNWNDETKIEDVQSVTLTNRKTDYTFENLPKTATTGEEYKYRVKEAPVNGYTPIYNEDFDIVNKYTPGKTEVTVNKSWVNIDLNTDNVPEVTINLYQNGTLYANKVLTKATGYSYKFEELPKYAKTGVEYEYTVQEVLKEGTVGYSSSNSGNINGVVTLTNTFDTTKINVTGQKQWEGVPDGAQVPEVTLKLLQNGKEVEGKVITLEAGVKENKTYSFTDLPKYSTDGKLYNYTVVEETIPGYESSGEGNSSNGYVITNTFTPETINVIGDKTWSNVTDTTKVPTITLYLESSLDGTNWVRVEGQVKQLTAADKPHYEFTNLPKYASDSREYKYRVVEEHIDGYTTYSNGSYNLLNVYTPGETAVKVTKKWTNVDPAVDTVPTVSIILKQDNVAIQSVVLDSSNNYTHTFTKLARYAETGKEYVYTVEEVLGDGVEGYTQNITPENDGYIVENIFDNTTIDINFTKVWEGINEDSVVPDIKLYLYQNGNKYTDEPVTLKGGNSENRELTYVFKELPKYSTDGNKYTYKVVEEIPDGYISNGESTVDADNNATITNTFDPGSVDVSGIKIWKNVSNERIVPTITLELQSSLDGEHWTAVPGKTLELAAGTTDYVFEGLPKYSPDSKEYQYKVVEKTVNGYETSYGKNNVITNTYKPGEKSIKVTKIWTNVDPKTDILPEVKILLKQDGLDYKEVTLDKDNDYIHKFENLPKYAETGEEYVYTVEEVLPEGTVGYNKEINPEDDGYVIENIFNNATIDVTFTKIWENVSDDSVVPNIYLDVYQNGNKYTEEPVMLKGGNKDNRQLTYVFKGLPKYSTEGKEYVYTIKENTIMGYKSTGEATVDANNNATITNRFTPGKVSISGTKTWNMVSESDLSSVPTITIRLQSSTDGILWSNVNDKVVELKAGELAFEFKDLPEYSVEGNKYKYRVVEDDVDGYKSLVDLNNNITNTYDPGETAVKVTKKWTDVDPTTSEVPVVIINLMRDGKEFDSIELTNSNGYAYIFANLPKYAPTGELYDYTIEEVLPDNLVGYEVKISLEGNATESKNVVDNEAQVEKSYIVENIFDKTTIDVNFTKVWEGINADSEVPEIKLYLYQDDKEFKTATLTAGVKADGKDSYVFEDLPKYSTAGKEYTYKVVEEVPDGYISSGEATVDANNNATITNAFDEGRIDVSGRKIWKDVPNEDIVPTITLTLESSLDGEAWIPVPGRTLELEAKTTKYVFEDLPKYSTDSREYQYRVVEAAVNGYVTSYDEEYNITNTYDPGKIVITVTKKWTNVDPSKDILPEVKIILKQDGKEVNNIVLDKENGYSYKFENLDKYAPTGKEYVYTIEEVLADEVEGYSKEIKSGENGFIIENTFDINAVTDITFTKVWANIPEDSEVPEVTLHLYQNGVEVTDKAVILDSGVKEDGKETYTFKDLPKYSTDGKVYVYTIKEDATNGYTSSGEANAFNEYTITNTYDGGEKVIISGKKTWVNVKNGDKVPDITIRVLRDGKEIHNIVVPSGTTTYEISAKEMVKYAEDGHEYKYELTEDKIDGFESVRDGYNFTNTNTVKEAVGGISDINTGDNNMIILYAGLAILSLSLISMITARKRKNARKIK
ncbi:Cna B-type domain-containing protein [Clostridium sp. SGI.024]|uniref:Cna B-type domain-containing protein n=1 Tax=Clostridium sp. SGI.024 TaxID=3420551 RepID=UPI003D03E1C4